MFHKARKLKYTKGTSFEVSFDTGEVKSYDVSVLFKKYPQLEAFEKQKTIYFWKTDGILRNYVE